MADTITLFRRALDGFEERIQTVGDDQWGDPTPCADWDVRTLVNHVVYEASWVPPLLAGQTVDEVGDRFDGDLLGDDPKAAGAAAREGAVAAADLPGVEGVTVSLSFGPAPALEYLTQIACDITIHTWDLARGAGAGDRLDPELVQFAWDYFSAHAEEWRAGGAFADPPPVPDGADLQARLLALTGRRA